MKTDPFCKRICIGLALAVAAGCGGGIEAPGEADDGTPATTGERLRHTREFIFVSRNPGDLTIVPFAFRSSDDGSHIGRSATAWLGRGGTWDRFLDEQQTGTRVGGVWRVVPYPNLRVTAGGPVEIESFGYEREERRLRLELAGPVSPWTESGGTRFRALRGKLVVGQETFEGPVLEMLDIERILEDGWPPAQDADALFLTSGDSVQIVLAESISPGGVESGYAWMKTSGVERSPVPAQVRWLEMRPLQEARREVPRQWSFSVPGFSLEGEVMAVGQDVLLGPERGGRRAVEIRYSVEGWFEIDGSRRGVVGMIRHLQQ